MSMVINRVGYIKLPEQLGFHRCAVNTHPDKIFPEPPLKKSWIRLCCPGIIQQPVNGLAGSRRIGMKAARPGVEHSSH